MYYIAHYTVETAKGSKLAPVLKIDLGVNVTEMTVAKAKRDGEELDQTLEMTIEEVKISGDDAKLAVELARSAAGDYIIGKITPKDFSGMTATPWPFELVDEAMASDGTLVVDDKEKEIKVWELRSEERAK